MNTKGTTHAPITEEITCAGCFTKTKVDLDSPGDRVYLDDILKELGWAKGKATGNWYCQDCAPVHRH